MRNTHNFKLALLLFVSSGTLFAQPDVSGITQPVSTVPSNYASCGILDNSICTSSVDAFGNPNFLATSANTSLPINGGSTPLIMFIGGVYQTLNTNVTLTVPSTASVQQWILAVQDTTNASMVAADFLAMNTAPYYQYTAPTCPSPSPSLSSTNPSFWYNLAANLAELCTTNGGSYSPMASMVIGTIYVDSTPKVANVLCTPYRLNAYRRYEQFGGGSAGVLIVSSGTTTIDTHKQYRSVLVTGGTVTSSSLGAGLITTGVSFQSQSGVMILGTAAISTNGLGRTQVSGTTGAGGSGSIVGAGGGGGGGGGSGTTSAAGGTGGVHAQFPISVQQGAGGGTPGTSAPSAGGDGGASVQLAPFQTPANCVGNSAGAGAGDSTNAGGIGGSSGGSIFIISPALLVVSTASVTANGNNGGNGAGGNAGGGGGGGGGCVILNAGFFSVAGATITVSGGTGGTGQGTGKNGGNGGAGLIQENKLW